MKATTLSIINTLADKLDKAFDDLIPLAFLSASAFIAHTYFMTYPL